MTVLRIRGRALTELAEDRFYVRVEEVADAGVEAAIVAPLTDGEPADTLDLQLDNAVLEGFLSE